MTADADDPPSIPTRSIAMLSFAAFASAANIRICDALLPDIARAYGVTVGQAAAVVTAFLIGYGVFQLVMGPVGDRFGKYRTVAIACTASGAVTLLNGFATGLDQLVVLRVVAGGLAGAIVPLSLAWIGDVVPYEVRQPVLARFLSGQIVGLLFGQAAGGVIGEWLGWQATFAVVGFCHLAAGAGLLLELRRSPQSTARPPGAVLDATGMLAAVAALWRRRWVRVLIAAGMLEAIAFHGSLAYVGSEMRLRFGLGAASAGLLLAALAFGALTYTLNARRLVDRFGQFGLARIGGATLCVGFTLLAVTPVVWLAPLATALLGLGFYMLHNTLQTNATQMAPEQRGLAISQFAIWFFIGQSLGTTAGGAVFDSFGGAPIFLAAAAIMPATAWWFCREKARHEAQSPP